MSPGVSLPAGGDTPAAADGRRRRWRTLRCIPLTCLDKELPMVAARLASLCIALGLCSSAGAADTPSAAASTEQLRLPALAGYTQVHQHTDAQGNRIVEYVPDGQTAQDWTDMVTLNDAPNSADARPRDYLGIIEAGWRIACPGAEGHWIHEGEENGRPSAVVMLSCPRNPGTGKPEFTWIKGIQGLQGFHSVQKSFRAEPEPEDVVTWVGWLREVALCGNGEAAACDGAVVR